MRADPAPPARQIQRTLGKLTEALADELTQPRAAAPAWDALEWRLAPVVASIHGIAGLLAVRLAWRGPQRWCAFLDAQRDHIAQRHGRILELLVRLDAAARAAGILVVPLKGAALHATGLYAPGERPMADLDLLVRAERGDAMAEVLTRLGYLETSTRWRHRTFEVQAVPPLAPLGEHTTHPIIIELHVRLAERLPVTPVDITRAVLPAHETPGLAEYPSRAALLAHELLHAAGNASTRGLRLIQLHDIARLCAAMDGREWTAFAALAGRADRLWWAAVPLGLASRYAGARVPQAISRTLERACPARLRRWFHERPLAAVSFSHIYVDPIPALAWARTPREMLRYLAGRLFPDPETRQMLHSVTVKRPWSPELQWYRQSHLRRILRLAVSRPTRPYSMLPVRAALEDP